jgi:diaminopimelate epimerase
MKFAKMEGLANDFIVTADTFIRPEMISMVKERAQWLCDRRRGIGADGVLCVQPSKSADFLMRVFNADGSEAEMCGNGVRCFALFLKNAKLWERPELSVETAAGIIRTSFEGERVRVNMGTPILDAPRIPAAKAAGEVVDETIDAGGRKFRVTAVSMGNPHAVVYADALTDELVLSWGPKLESHPFFPKRTNVEFVKILSRNEIRMRVYERGCGETMACGTGACASMVSGVLNGLNGTPVIVHLLGGDLSVEWNGERQSPVYMTGPAKWVYAGEISL